MSEGTKGGLKEVIAEVHARGCSPSSNSSPACTACTRARHRAPGHSHSAATVAVLPEVEDVDIDIDEKDLKIDPCARKAPVASTSIRLNPPSASPICRAGLSCSCRKERSQHKNKAKALAYLRTKLYDQQRKQARCERPRPARADRFRRPLGTHRTYNYRKGRVTDHRINLTLYKLPQVMEGGSAGRTHWMRWSPSIRPNCWQRGRHLTHARHSGLKDGASVAETLRMIGQSFGRRRQSNRRRPTPASCSVHALRLDRAG